MQDSDRQEDRNSRVFLKAKVLQASSHLNPDWDKIKFLVLLVSDFRTQISPKQILRYYLGLELKIIELRT